VLRTLAVLQERTRLLPAPHRTTRAERRALAVDGEDLQDLVDVEVNVEPATCGMVTGAGWYERNGSITARFVSV
jgi:hypothetical protein